MDDNMERGTICIVDNCNKSQMVETIVEEWAHARTTFLNDEEDESDDPWHHASFWAEYGRICNAARERKW
tara:strand:+ start:5289 stop:5498 length:210 start_codon:yes stop_codon:yes gene_type:complete